MALGLDALSNLSLSTTARTAGAWLAGAEMGEMTSSQLRGRLEGVIAYPVTNFKPDYSLDIDGCRTDVAEMAKFPLCAIVAAGGAGELIR